jgi:uncharacterized protein YndB with AHSA1/START domain
MAEAPTPESEIRIGIEITRTFEAPRELVWREWTEPERFADWFGGTQGHVPIESVSMDVRPGGALRLTMLQPGSREIEWEGEYIEVREPERLVFAIRDQPGDGPYEEISVALTDLGDGRTEMQFQQRGRMSPEQYGRAEQGWGTFFARLDERLAKAAR